MKNGFILLTAILSIFFFGCQKEADLQGISTNGNAGTSGSGAIDLSGTWKFISFHAKTLATNEVVAGAYTMKTVTTSDYTSENNTGTVVFNTNSMSYDNLSYSINTVAFASTYENGVLIDTLSVPMQANLPATKGQSNFTAIGADSLYFQGGSTMFGASSQTTKPSGVKIKREQDKLYLTQKVAESNNTTVQGQTVKSNQQAEIVTTFQKQ